MKPTPSTHRPGALYRAGHRPTRVLNDNSIPLTDNSLPRSQVHQRMEGAASPPVDPARGAPARPQAQVRHCKREQAALPPRLLFFDSLAVARGVRRRRGRTERGGKCEGGAEVKAAAFRNVYQDVY